MIVTRSELQQLLMTFFNRHDENRLNYFIRVSRSLLGPRGIDRHFSTTLAGQSDLVESVILTHRHQNDPFSLNSTAEIPSHILAVQTDREFSSSTYNKLSFAHYYREEDKQRPHIWFPQVTEALRKALLDPKYLQQLHVELSLLLSALSSIKDVIPLNNYS